MPFSSIPAPSKDCGFVIFFFLNYFRKNPTKPFEVFINFKMVAIISKVQLGYSALQKIFLIDKEISCPLFVI